MNKIDWRIFDKETIEKIKIMTPKEKAEELLKKYNNYVSAWTSTNKPDENPSARYEGNRMKIGRAKQCALIAVDEMIVQNGELYLNSLGEKTISFYREKNSYLFEVKSEIENYDTKRKSS